MYLVRSPKELQQLLHEHPDLWLPDNLLLLQQCVPVDPTQGIYTYGIPWGSFSTPCG
jgi:hypothetical protein